MLLTIRHVWPEDAGGGCVNMVLDGCEREKTERRTLDEKGMCHLLADHVCGSSSRYLGLNRHHMSITVLA